MSKISKRKLIHILFYFLVQVPTFFYGVYRCSNRQKGLVEYSFITAETIKTGSSVIYDKGEAEVGEITLMRNDDGLVCSIEGAEIHRVSVLDKEYTFNKIEYNNMRFTLKDHNNERYWYCDTGNSILLINKVRRKSYQWFGNKKEELYFFCEMSKEYYHEITDNIFLRNDPLQEMILAGEEEELYFCIFMQ